VRAGIKNKRIQTVVVNTDDGLVLHGWMVPASPSALRKNVGGRPAAGITLIYFPGNGGNRGFRAAEMDLLAELGATVYLFDYRGYGDNSGDPTERHLAADAQAVWRKVTQHEGAQPSEVVLLGESLGGGVATRLAAELSREGSPPGGLILRSTFSSLADVAAQHYEWAPVGFFLVDRFQSNKWIAGVQCPILVLHGDADTIVPMRLAKTCMPPLPKNQRVESQRNLSSCRAPGTTISCLPRVKNTVRRSADSSSAFVADSPCHGRFICNRSLVWQ
jgi:uncharacterized protein